MRPISDLKDSFQNLTEGKEASELSIPQTISYFGLIARSLLFPHLRTAKPSGTWERCAGEGHFFAVQPARGEEGLGLRY